MPKTKLKAWVKYSNGVLTSTPPHIGTKAPSGKGWKRIPYEECCDTLQVTPTP